MDSSTYAKSLDLPVPIELDKSKSKCEQVSIQLKSSEQFEETDLNRRDDISSEDELKDQMISNIENEDNTYEETGRYNYVELGHIESIKPDDISPGNFPITK